MVAKKSLRRGLIKAFKLFDGNSKSLMQDEKKFLSTYIFYGYLWLS
jgi:hypothetical protein